MRHTKHRSSHGSRRSLRSRLGACAAALSLLGAGAALAEPQKSPTAAATQSDTALLPVWNAFVDELRALAPAMLEKLPPRLKDDPQTQQEVGRLMIEAISARSLTALASDGDHPLFVPSLNILMNVYQPNADTIYKETVITPGGSYRLRGTKGNVRIAMIGAFPPFAADGTLKALAYYDINRLKAGPDGKYDVLLSPTRPEGYDGDWWQLDPKAIKLMLRQVAMDWATEVDPSISIERIDASATAPRPKAEILAKNLREFGPAVKTTAIYLVDHVQKLRADGFINKLRIWDVTGTAGGLTGQFYYEGAYDLKVDEALLIESPYPKNCHYASLILTNDIFETTDWYNNQSSLNAAQWRVDNDGKLRVVVSAKDPGVPNWLDTSGYATGVVQGRWTGCDSTPIPATKKVKLSRLKSLLPKDTPKVSAAERDKIVRDRRAQFQQRRLW